MSPVKNDLAGRLAEENTAWTALIDTLADEERALIRGDAEGLAALNAVKLEHLHAASGFARARAESLRVAGFSLDAAGMEAWLTAHGSAAVRIDWQRLQVLEDEARASNARVGKLIEMRLSVNRQALNVLMHAAAGQNGLYDPSGQTVAVRGGAPLAAA